MSFRPTTTTTSVIAQIQKSHFLRPPGSPVSRMYQAGKIRPHVSAHYPLAEAGQAIRDLAERRAMGKIVVMID